jgi:hypothetical protein
MFMQKIIASPRFLGTLFLRFLLGIVVGHLWVAAVALVFHLTGENVVSEHATIGYSFHIGNLYEYFDSKYDTSSPVFRIVAWVACIGNLGCMAVGILWGFSQGRLDLRRLLRKRRLKKIGLSS